MQTFFSLLLLFIFSPLIYSLSHSSEVIHSWISLDFLWESESQKSLYLKSGLFIPENCAITGIKTYKNEIYVTVPRWLRGVPSTLNKIENINERSPLLTPFPSWNHQNISNPNGFKYIQSMEIDSKGRMWIIDVGRLNIADDPQSVINGPAKIVILDLKTLEIIKYLEISDDVAPYNSSFLNDIVLDEERGFAYISDTSGAIIIYDFNNNFAKRWRSVTMKNEPNVNFTIDGIDYGNKQFTTPVDGIALTRTGNQLFYCALQGLHLYTIETKYLRDFSFNDYFLETKIKNIGLKKSPSDGMTIGREEDILYFGGLTTDSLYSWNITQEFSPENQKVEEQNNENLHWIDTFAWMNDRDLLMTTNKLDLFLTKKMDFTGRQGANFKILKKEMKRRKKEK